ncbi:helix-turn-helix transcriptional regulator [Kitasatospora acidiphila]|uniref:Helix-turn-helix transcriptional regulator n=1 Tax=Kitasatospora acidiphila TaxID=2567942 RepID=A0A540W537_9ACTN|nr:helix-turn-helix transcriptional regulator [Kitasatospora acidiphila]TQF04151.1 helix-turn-helix transcriptional regulator [Kitasatospora acidiphila]
MPSAEQTPAPRSLAEKLDHLFQVIHPADRGPFSYHEVAQAIREQAGPDGPTVSHGTLQQIRTGAKTNPTVKTLEAIAAFFGVPAAYFLDDTVADRVDVRLRELKAAAENRPVRRAATAPRRDELADVLADSDIRAVAFRLAGLSPRALKGLRAIVDQVRAVEGLPEVGRTKKAS